MARGKILVVDDEEDILEVVRYNLAREGFSITGVGSGEAAIREVRTQHPDLIILDLMLPGIDGLEVAKILKADPSTSDIPILMLTAKGGEADIVTGLELGADDYVTKPFSPRVLLARVKAMLRRNREHKDGKIGQTIVINELTIHPGRHEVTLAGKPINLTHSEFMLLLHLARRPGWVFTRNQIVDAVHGEDYAVTERSVDVLIAGLRKKLGAYGKYIETVRGVGYRFKDKRI